MITAAMIPALQLPTISVPFAPSRVIHFHPLIRRIRHGISGNICMREKHPCNSIFEKVERKTHENAFLALRRFMSGQSWQKGQTSRPKQAVHHPDHCFIMTRFAYFYVPKCLFKWAMADDFCYAWASRECCQTICRHASAAHPTLSKRPETNRLLQCMKAPR